MKVRKQASFWKGFPSSARDIANQHAEKLKDFEAFTKAWTADHAEFVVFDREVDFRK